ncbi:MAG: hypothetical protein K2L32_04205 [Muribaculaceae bacterium]|nr:hypothetical protein [Muribaculaceae bacterium]
MPKNFNRLKQWLSRLSFRTGIIAVILCALCYTISFAQMLLPISSTAKGILWAVFFGIAKTLQYGALLILGTTGISRLKSIFKREQ